MTTEEVQTISRYCDGALYRAIEAMVESGAPVPLVLDRIMTFAAAQAVSMTSSAETAQLLRKAASEIERGRFAQFEANIGGRLQ